MIDFFQVIAIAMIVSLIFKKLDDDDVEDDERKRNARAASDEELTDAPQGSLYNLYWNSPITRFDMLRSFVKEYFRTCVWVWIHINCRTNKKAIE